MQPSLAMYIHTSVHILPSQGGMQRVDDAATHNLLRADGSSGYTGSHCLSHMRTRQFRLLKNVSRAHSITECKYHRTEKMSCMLKKGIHLPMHVPSWFVLPDLQTISLGV